MIEVEGAVQGVGFRPFVASLARRHRLGGFVQNTMHGARFAFEGNSRDIARALKDFNTLPRLAFITKKTVRLDEPLCGDTTFRILSSDADGETTAHILPDASICPDCLRELFNPKSRFHRYPFISCTNCGPRATITTGLPYDRPKTSMRDFPMCPDCRREYEDPADRRYHAQPIACPECGPQLVLWNKEGETIAEHDDALCAAAQAIQGGKIVAVKGLGGFQLIVDATNEQAVRALRTRKHREDKPFALMYPTLELLKGHTILTETEHALLSSSASPIVLLRRKQKDGALKQEYYPADNVVGERNPLFGIMLPYTPLHALLLKEVGRPVVATSGNIADDPIITNEKEALERLANVADLFLVHDRPIVRPMDDSIVRMTSEGPLILRRARGYAPFPVRIPNGEHTPLAVGAHQKNTVAMGIGEDGRVSQHIGDLGTIATEESFTQAIADLKMTFRVQPNLVVADLHPDYASTEWAEESGMPIVRVQHHVAHVLAVAGEHGLTGSYLGVAMDGTGYGLDKTIWGGEFFAVSEQKVARIAHLRPFRLPGNERASREGYRCAFGICDQLQNVETNDLPFMRHIGENEKIFRTMCDKGLNAPYTSSIGRLFDAIASLLGVRQQSGFEGHAAMELEWRADRAPNNTHYHLSPLRITQETDGCMVLDWREMITSLITGMQSGVSTETLAAAFHDALAQAIVMVAQQQKEERVVLSGGCFQNKRLLETTIRLLRESGFVPFRAEVLPSNDGAIAYGQLVFARQPKEVS
jgi:hydrogenase maturation protein HypF